MGRKTKKISEFFSLNSIRGKILLPFLALVIVCFLAIYLIVDFIFTQTMVSVGNDATVQAINQVNINAENQLKNTENIINLICENSQVTDFFRSEPDRSIDDRNIRKANIRSFLANIIQTNSSIYGISLINKYDDLLSNEMYRVMDDMLIDEDWYKNAVEQPDQVLIIGHPTNRNLSYYKNISADVIISEMKAVLDYSTGEVLGVVLIDLKQQVFEEMQKSVKLGQAGFTFIMDENGDVIYSPVNYIVPRIRSEWFSNSSSPILNKYISGQLYQFIYSTSQYTKWKTVGVFSLNEQLQQVVNVRYYIIIVVTVMSILVIIVSVLLSSSVVRPIRKLRYLMKDAENGNLSVKFESKSVDEVAQLGNSFNAMLIKINDLIRMVYREQQHKRQAELITLQAQIKPHFLYNTFDTINWMALKYEADDIVQLVNSLTSLFRIGLSKGDEIIHVWEEIEHLRSYLIIQKIRYADLLDYEIIVPDEIRMLYVQKLILQPIVENAIYHGIKNKKNGGKITITGAIDSNSLCFFIKDDGKGMTKEKTEELNKAIKRDNSKKLGYGLINVNERIKLSYGNGYGVSIESTENIGTVVTIKHPIIVELKEENDV